MKYTDFRRQTRQYSDLPKNGYVRGFFLFYFKLDVYKL